MAERVEIMAPEYHAECTAVLSYWYAAVGDTVQSGDDLLDYETDKASVTLESPVHGVLREIAVPEDGVIQPGMLLAIVEKTE